MSRKLLKLVFWNTKTGKEIPKPRVKSNPNKEYEKFWMEMDKFKSPV